MWYCQAHLDRVMNGLALGLCAAVSIVQRVIVFDQAAYDVLKAALGIASPWVRPC